MTSRNVFAFIYGLCLWVSLAGLMPGRSEGEEGSKEQFVFLRPGVGVQLRAGSSTDRVFFNDAPYVAPRLSPDSNFILFNSVEGGTMGVWLFDRAANQKRRICDGTQGAWSPDGKKVLLQRAGQIIEHDLTSGAETMASPDALRPLAFPSYSPKGAILCTHGAGESLGQVLLIANDRTTPPRTLAKGEILSAPRCSGDGKMLAYQDGAHIYVMDIETGGARLLTPAPGIQAWPVWAEDGQSVCYAQAPNPLAEKWDICRVDITRPQTVNLIEHGLRAAFDWRGSHPSSRDTETVAGVRLDLRKTPTSNPAAPPTPAAAVENDWLILDLSAKGLLLVPKQKGASQKPIILRFTDDQGADLGPLRTIEQVPGSGDKIELKASFGPAGEKGSSVVFGLRHSRPIIEVRPEQESTRVLLDADLSLALMPDRFGNDLVLDPNRAAVGTRMVLPETSVSLGCLAEPRALLMIISPSDSQSVALSRSKAAPRFDETVVAPAGKSIFISVVVGEHLWDELPLKTAGGKLSAKWHKPFPAQWRMAVCGKDQTFSRTWTEDDLGALGGAPLPIEEPFSEPPKSAFVYIYGRDANTPLNVLTPTDLLLDILGIQGYARALDIEGLCGYRSADEWVPLRDISTYKTDLPGGSQEEGPFGVLDAMVALNCVSTKGTRLFLTHLSGDALNLLRGLDKRIGEYEAFCGELKAFCQKHKEEDRGGFLASVAEQADRALKSGRDAPRTGLARVTEASQAMLAILGVKEGGLSGRPEFREFSRRCRKAQEERQGILSEYRTAVESVRDRAAQAVMAEPGFKSVGDQLRDMTQRILRDRYYLEGDWRGEKPLLNGALP